MKHKNAVNRVRKHFPKVNQVVDAKEPVLLTVKKVDVELGKKKDATSCALARACLRTKGVDGAIIQIGFSYLIRGDTATRYKTSQTVGREIVSFDRNADFAYGKNYRLSAISKSHKLGRYKTPKGRKTGPKNSKAKRPQIHRTSRIRVSGVQEQAK